MGAADLLAVAATPGRVTERGVRTNVEVAVRYLAARLGVSGAVAIHVLMEDAATAEISRSQLWQWIRNATPLDTGEPVTAALVRRVLDEESAAVRAEVGEEAWSDGRWAEAVDLVAGAVLSEDFVDFVTLPAYARAGDR